jgi:predicted dehydrogenase
MSGITRRDLIQAAGTTLAMRSFAGSSLYASETNTRPVLGFIGCGGRSRSLLARFAPEATVAWACDPDKNRAETFQRNSGARHVTADLREVLDDESVQAVVVATPDHWHAPAAILACEAGKHVYVEKPCSHNLREGRLLVEAARRNNVVVQHGTQSRSDPLVAGAIQMLREGIIGDVLIARAWNVQRRRNIGHQQPSEPPPTVDYDAWVGPAEFMPYQSNRFHYDWHWWYNFGTGDIGNDGAHEMDIARWGLGVEGLPASAMALGGKYYFDDDQQFPDTATCAFEWPGNNAVGQQRQLIFEMRIWSKSYPYNCDTGVEFLGTKGMLFVSKRGKLQVWDDANRPIEDPAPQNVPLLSKNHQVDFLRAIATGGKPAADIAIAHDSVALIHLANIAVRQGRSLAVDPVQERVIGDSDSNAMLARSYRAGGHWAVPKGV